MNPKDCVVVGGGLAGMCTAALLARSGRKVVLVEGTAHLGGRAQSSEHQGHIFNIGPHALYRGGAAERVFTRLGIRALGKSPASAGGVMLRAHSRHTLPVGFVSLLTTGGLGLAAKVEFARLWAALPRIDPAPLARQSVTDWLAGALRHAESRALVQAFVRLSTYCHAPDLLSAEAAVSQLQVAMKRGVLYLDRGWQSLVEGAEQAARAAGVEILTGSRALAVERDGNTHSVRLADERRLPTRTAVLAVAPKTASQLLRAFPHSELHAVAEHLVPVRAACLTVALRKLPVLRATFALGFDAPTYLSVHSAFCDLGGVVVHLARYLEPDAHDIAMAPLEDMLEREQPGWQRQLIDRQWLPTMTVSHALVTAGMGGLSGRPSPAVPAVPGVFVVGDWVGGEGMLLDAALASAEAACEAIATAT